MNVAVQACKDVVTIVIKCNAACAGRSIGWRAAVSRTLRSNFDQSFKSILDVTSFEPDSAHKLSLDVVKRSNFSKNSISLNVKFKFCHCGLDIFYCCFMSRQQTAGRHVEWKSPRQRQAAAEMVEIGHHAHIVSHNRGVVRQREFGSGKG